MFQHGGVLPGQLIRELISARYITGTSGARVSSASLDLVLSEEVYRLRGGLFQLRNGERVRDLLSVVGAKKHSYHEPFMPNVLYLARLSESIHLPDGVYGYCNPKSTTGRVDLHVRVLADGVPRYDSLEPAGWSGELWIAIYSRSFAVVPGVEQALAQLRLFTSDTRFSELELQIAVERYRLLWRPDGSFLKYRDLYMRDRDGGLAMSLDQNGDTIGWKSKRTKQVLELGTIGTHDPDDFFEEVRVRPSGVHLKSGQFYILSTNELLRVPPHLACEMEPVDARFGDFRTHYAGFIDPGWGYGLNGEVMGRPITLELRPFEDLLVRADQPIAKVRFEKMIHVPDEVYDARASSYSVQERARLPKQFKQ